MTTATSRDSRRSPSCLVEASQRTASHRPPRSRARADSAASAERNGRTSRSSRPAAMATVPRQPRAKPRSSSISSPRRAFRATVSSRGTVARHDRNAVEVAARTSPHRATADYLVTSPFHQERALVVFRNVLGFAWQVQAVSAEDTDDDRERANRRPRSPGDVHLLRGIKPGDMATIDKKYRARTIRW